MKVDWKQEWFQVKQRLKLTTIRQDLTYLFTHIAIGTSLSYFLFGFLKKEVPDSTHLVMYELPILGFIVVFFVLYNILDKISPKNQILEKLPFTIIQVCNILYSRFIEATLYAVGVSIYILLVNINDYLVLISHITISYAFLLLVEHTKSISKNIEIKTFVFYAK